MGPRYRHLLDDYANELRSVKDEVTGWWENLLTQTTAKLGDRMAAETDLKRRWPVGPVAHPRILAIIRKYYFACDQLNKEIYATWTIEPDQIVPHHTANEIEQAEPDDETEDQPVNPVFLVGEALVSPATMALAVSILKLPYWPVGMDESGNRV
jgi:hypothetical protein